MQAREHAKTVSKPYVVSAFSLDTLTSKSAIRDKVEQLLYDACYIYNVCSIQTHFQVTILILSPAGIEPRAAVGDIPAHLSSRH